MLITLSAIRWTYERRAQRLNNYASRFLSMMTSFTHQTLLSEMGFSLINLMYSRSYILIAYMAYRYMKFIACKSNWMNVFFKYGTHLWSNFQYDRHNLVLNVLQRKAFEWIIYMENCDYYHYMHKWRLVFQYILHLFLLKLYI